MFSPARTPALKVIAAAGAVDHAELVALSEEMWGDLPTASATDFPVDFDRARFTPTELRADGRHPTIAMLERNLVRLHANFHGSATPPANFTTDSWRGKKVEPSTTWKYVATVAVALAAGAGLALAAGRRR